MTGQGFADDCGPMIGGDNTHEMYKSMQRMLNKLYHWGEGKNLKFNPTKTVAVLFSKKQIKTKIPKTRRQVYQT